MKTIAALAIATMLAIPAHAACRPGDTRGVWMLALAATDYPATATCLTVVSRSGKITHGWCDEDSDFDGGIVRNVVTDGKFRVNRSCMVQGELGTGFALWTFKRGWLARDRQTLTVIGDDTFFGAVWSGVGLRR